MSNKMLFYGEESDDLYNSIEYMQDEADNREEEIEVVEMEIDPEGAPWCTMYSKIEPECDILCEYSSPLNRVDGKCKHLTKTLRPTGKVLTLTPDTGSEI